MSNNNENSNSSNIKFKLLKENKSGCIINGQIVSTVVPVILALGLGSSLLIKLAVDEVNKYITMGKYSYDSDYDSYSAQIEDVIGVDLDTSLEDDLNSLGFAREIIEDYQTNDSLISRAESLKLLESQKDNIETISLNISKKWCANEWGGNASDYVIRPESSFVPGWVATHPETGTHEVPRGTITDFLDSIGELQGYSKERIERVNKSSEFVDLCNNVVRYSGMVAADLSKGKSK